MIPQTIVYALILGSLLMATLAGILLIIFIIGDLLDRKVW